MRGSSVIIFMMCAPLLCRRLKAYFCYHDRQIAYVHRCIGIWCVHMHPSTWHRYMSSKSTIIRTRFQLLLRSYKFKVHIFFYLVFDQTTRCENPSIFQSLQNFSLQTKVHPINDNGNFLIVNKLLYSSKKTLI